MPKAEFDHDDHFQGRVILGHEMVGTITRCELEVRNERPYKWCIEIVDKLIKERKSMAYQMREGLAEHLMSRGYAEEMSVSDLPADDKEILIETVSGCTANGVTDWERVALLMQFDYKLFPTGWEKLFNELQQLDAQG